MPIFYNTGAPAGGSSNSITITAKDLGLRDFLLSKNIQNPIRYPQLSTSVNGGPRGGEPVLDTMVGTGVVIPQIPIEVDGLIRYSIAILPNHYKDMDPAAPILLNIDTVLPSHPTGYPMSPSGTLDYSQEDHAQFGIGGISDYYEFRKKATLRNLYVDASKQIDMADLISLQPIQTNQQLPSYDQAWGELTAGGEIATNAVNAIGSVLNGQGVGIDLARGGIATNFDIRSSLAGRVLGATGLLNDTKLGIIGGQQLALSLANNAAFNVQQSILGSLNVSDNLLSLFKGNGLVGFRPDYKITVPTTVGGGLVNTAQKILGFQVPRSYLEDGGSIFSDENGYIENISRANNMIENTGKGQVEALKVNINANVENIQGPFRSGYVPGFRDKRGDELAPGPTDENGDKFDNNIQGYAFMNAEGFLTTNFLKPSSNGVIPDLSWNREKLVEDSGFVAPANTNIDFELSVFLGEVVSNTLIDTYGNGVKHINNPTFSWVASNTTGTTKQLNATPLHIGGAGNKKTLLGKTQMLFNDKGMRNLVSVKGDMTIVNGSQLQTSVVNGGISKGSAVLRGDLFDANGNITNVSKEAENTFCRSWTTFDRYDKVYKLIRNRGLNQSENLGTPIFPEGNKWRYNTKGSVLDDNGFVKIAPYKTDDLTRSASDPKKYMFSIENLAWAGSPAANLLPVEQGPGDLLTGKFGRIMWFPPYDLTFSESSSVSLESTNFIGRGEPIYTYNNTERTGSLSFKIIMDHPSIMNAFKGNDGPPDEFIRSWYAGCVDLDSKWADLLTKEEVTKRETKKALKVEKKLIFAAIPPDTIKIYFPNDVTKIDSILFGADDKKQPPQGMAGTAPNDYYYECGATAGYLGPGTLGIGDYNGEPQQRKEGGPFVNSPEAVPQSRKVENGGDGLKLWPDTTDGGLNGPNNKLGINGIDYANPKGWNDPRFIADLKEYLNPTNPKNGCPECKAVCTGYASSQGTSYANTQLLKNRAESMKKWLLDNGILSEARIKIDITKSKVKSGNYTIDTPVDQAAVKADRYGAIVFVNDVKDTLVDVTTEVDEIVQVSLNQQVKRRFYTESDFFEKLKQTDPLVFDTLKQKIRYFDPAFHSMTPEGFNSRLTFLLQCTRQGPTISDSGPANLAFGPQPVCILRIGDFYNTKIMMDNLSIDYEPLVWDLNPEGVGVQPMIANVTISFKYIGGSSLYSPINKLQNALSFNYFANTQVYDPRADYVAKVSDLDTATLAKLGNPLADRKTFGDENPDAKPESNYGLVTGLDSTKTSMGATNPNEVTTKEANTENTKNPNQVNASDAATSTANSSAANPELARLKLRDVEASGINWGAGSTVSFTIARADADKDKASLNQDYDLTVNIKGKELTSDNFTIKLPKKLEKGDFTKIFNFNLSDMTPSCTGLTLSSSSYSFEVVVGAIGSLNSTIDKISGGTTVTTIDASTTNFTDDEVLKCISLGFPAASNIYDSNTFDINFTFQPHLTESRPQQTIDEFILKDKHQGKVYLIENNKTNSKVLLATILISPNLGLRGVDFQAIDEQGTNASDTISGKPPQPWSTTIELNKNLDLVKSALTKDGTCINIAWDNGSSMNANWSYPSSTNNDDIEINGGFFQIEDCDKAHNFKEMIKEINNAQTILYNKGINPKVKKLVVKIYKMGKFWAQDYDVIVGKSDDGKAWTGFDTRGSCGAGYIGRADDQYLGRGTPGQSIGSPCYLKTLEKCLQDGANAGDVELITTYQNDTDQFKQYFVQFTKTTMPAK